MTRLLPFPLQKKKTEARKTGGIETLPRTQTFEYEVLPDYMKGYLQTGPHVLELACAFTLQIIFTCLCCTLPVFLCLRQVRQKPGTRSPVWVCASVPSTWAMFCVFRHISRELDQSRAVRTQTGTSIRNASVIDGGLTHWALNFR